MNDQVVVANHGIDETNGGTDLSDIRLAPRQAEWIFNPPLDGHDFEEWMVEQFFDLAVHQRVKIPEGVYLHKVCVIAGQNEIRIVLQEQIRHIIQMHEPIERRRSQT